MNPVHAFSLAAAVAAAVACGDAPRDRAPTRAAGTEARQVATPGALLRRFPSATPQAPADTFFESAFTLTVGERSAFVLDAMAGRVFRFDREGRLQGVVGRRGPGPGELQSPVALREDAAGLLRVADPRAGRLARFRPDGSYDGQTVTPHPVTNFTVLESGEIVVPTLSANTLLGTLDDAGRVRRLVVDPAKVPESLRRGPRDRVPLGVLAMVPWATDTLLLFRNRHATDFRAWLVALTPRRDSIRDVRPLPLPGWLYTLIEEEVALLRRQLPDELEQGDFLVPFKSVRNVDGTVWLAPADG